MSSEQRLIKLQKEMRDLENLEMKTQGALDSLCKRLAKDINQPGLSSDEINKAGKARVKELKLNIKKSKKMFDEKMIEIDEMSEKMEG